MTIKTFNNQIIVQPLLKSDLKNSKKFQNFINSFVEEEAMITTNKKMTLKQEVDFLENTLRKMKNRRMVFLFAKDRSKGVVIGTTSVELRGGNQSHVGTLGILVKKDYRRLGLGTFLMKEIIKSAKKDLRPHPKIIRLSVYHLNAPALKLYRKIGFKKVATIPRQLRHKGELLDEVVMMLEV